MSRIGLTQRVAAARPYAERRDCLDQNWARLLCRLDLIPVPLLNAVEDVSGYLDSLDLGGVILTGGNDLADLKGARNTAPERDRFESRLLEACLAKSIPVVGVCRGMQVINRHFGGWLAPASGHAGARHRVSRSGFPLPYWDERFEVNSYHGFAVPADGLAAPLQPIALCQDGTVEALRQADGACLGFMWHPEREVPPTRRDAETLRSVFARGRR